MAEAEELVRRSGGPFRVLTSAELTALGIYRTTVARLVATGRWQRLWRGVYLCSPHPPTALHRAHAAVKHADSSPAIVTGLAGAAAMGMRWVPEHTKVQVLVGPDVQRSSNDGVLLRRAWDVASVETWNWGGLMVAEASRLVVDGARECTSLRDVRGLVLGAIADGRTSPDEVLGVLAGGATGGTLWCRRAARDAVRGAASPAEAEVIDGMLGRGRPFVVNRDAFVGELFVGKLDGYLLGTGVGYEVDSKERHGSSVNMSATLLRHERASRGGALSLVHVTPASYRSDPADFFARLEQEVAYRESAGLGEPAGFRLGHGSPVLR